jgi:hypothetical protein
MINPEVTEPRTTLSGTLGLGSSDWRGRYPGIYVSQHPLRAVQLASHGEACRSKLDRARQEMGKL